MAVLLGLAVAMTYGAADFLGGFEIGDAFSLRITFTGGSLIVYGATVDNTTQDPSAQFMQPLAVTAP